MAPTPPSHRLCCFEGRSLFALSGRNRETNNFQGFFLQIARSVRGFFHANHRSLPEYGLFCFVFCIMHSHESSQKFSKQWGIFIYQFLFLTFRIEVKLILNFALFFKNRMEVKLRNRLLREGLEENILAILEEQKVHFVFIFSG